MALTIIARKKEYIIAPYRARALKDGFIVINDYGNWVYLDRGEYNSLRTEKLNDSLYIVLKDRGILQDEDNSERIISEYRQRLSFLFQGTSLHIMIPTNRCNISCSYCHANAVPQHRKGYDMTEATARKAVEFVFQSPSPSLMVECQGGEALLNWKTTKLIYQYAEELNKKHKRDLRFSIVTNLTLMDDEKVKFLRRYKVGLCTSLDGPERLHNQNRQKFDKTKYWIKRINQKHQAKNDAILNAMPLVTRYSLGCPEEIVDEYLSLGLDKRWLKPVSPLGRGSGCWGRIGIGSKEFLEFWRRAMDYIVKKNDGKIVMRELASQILLRKIVTNESVNFTDLQSPCGAAIGQLIYNYDGRIFTCDEGRLSDVFNIGTVEDTYRRVLGSKETLGIVEASLNDNNTYCDSCAYKPYCGVCPVHSYCTTGKLIPSLPNRRCEIFMGMFDYIFEKLVFDERSRSVFLQWVEKSRMDHYKNNQNV